jgi:hypothetical protein
MTHDERLAYYRFCDVQLAYVRSYREMLADEDSPAKQRLAAKARAEFEQERRRFEKFKEESCAPSRSEEAMNHG